MLTDTAATRMYLDRELAENEQFAGPTYEPTGWEHRFYRVNLSAVKNGLIDRAALFDAFYRSQLAVDALTDEQWREEWKEIVKEVSLLDAPLKGFSDDSLLIVSMMAKTPQAVHHSPDYYSAYAPHYRIIAKDIFEREILPHIKDADLATLDPEDAGCQCTCGACKDASPHPKSCCTFHDVFVKPNEQR